ncbi:MAG: Rieske (2Fe-2S) protein [Chloroflexia bacterium]
MPKLDVGAPEEFVEGKIRLVSAAGKEIGLVKWQGRFYAMHNVCPHQGGPACGSVLPYLRVGREGKVGSLSAKFDSPIILCGWHAWEFDARTGQALCDPKMRVKTYPVKVAKGRVVVDMGGVDK